MTNLENRRVTLNACPLSVPGEEVFTISTTMVESLKASEFLIHNIYLSVDPAMRGWTNDAPNYFPPVIIVDVMHAIAVGEIIASESPDYIVGD